MKILDKINKYNVLYIIKNIIFIIFLFTIVKIIPNLFEIGIIGLIFTVILILYIIIEMLLFAIKDKNIKKSNINNTITITLYIYIIMIAIKYLDSANSIEYIINPTYFKINYVIAMFGIVGLIGSQLSLLFND